MKTDFLSCFLFFAVYFWKSGGRHSATYDGGYFPLSETFCLCTIRSFLIAGLNCCKCFISTTVANVGRSKCPRHRLLDLCIRGLYLCVPCIQYEKACAVILPLLDICHSFAILEDPVYHDFQSFIKVEQCGPDRGWTGPQRCTPQYKFLLVH